MNRDPRLFDAVAEGREWDARWYLALARAAGGPVLEVGAGTARLLLPLLSAGVDAWGLEREPAMAAHGRTKIARALGPETTLRLLEGDVRDFAHDRRYRLVALTWNVVCALKTPDDLARGLERIAAHLAPGGELALDMVVADALPWSRPPYHWGPARRSLEVDGIPVQFEEEGRFDPATRLHSIEYRYRFADGSTRQETFALRAWGIDELEAALAARGWHPCAPPVDDQGRPRGEKSAIHAARYSLRR